MPIINLAWEKSFAWAEKNRQEIVDREISPLNWALLLDDELRSTMTKKQQLLEFLSDNNIIFPSNSTTSKTALSSSDQSSRTNSNSSGISSICDSDNVSTDASLNFNSTLPSFLKSKFMKPMSK